MGKYAVGGRVSRAEREPGAHAEKVSAPVSTGVAEFGTPVPQLPGRTHQKRKLTDEEKGSGFFTDPKLKNPKVLELVRDPNNPVNYVWVEPGEFSSGPINSDVEDHGGILKGRARVANTGATFTVRENDDIRFLGTVGWWPESRRSAETTSNTRPREAKPLKLFRRRS